MQNFEWASASSVDDAIKLLNDSTDDDPDQSGRPIAGGQDLLTVMKEHIIHPKRVVNLKTIDGLEGITADASGNLTIGPLTKLATIEHDPTIKSKFPGLSEAAESIASTQLRNMGTVGGNLCQRPRCWYFRLEDVICIKKGGSECYAAKGENKYHAIFGGGPSYIVHPSDLAPMLICLNAEVTLTSSDGKKNMPLGKFFTLPRTGVVTRENVLGDADLLTEIRVPASALAARSTYLKFKERTSLDFAMLSCAAAIELGPDQTVSKARIVLGAVAPIPWHVPKAEQALIGKPLDDATIADAAEIALAGAEPLAKNAYKIPLGKTIVRRALSRLKET
jgi:xanthine dehydrogenase YagS FAD-binding subunit